MCVDDRHLLGALYRTRKKWCALWRSVARLNMLIFEWLDGEYVACLINFISPPAFSRLVTAATTGEGEEKTHAGGWCQRKEKSSDAASERERETENRTEGNIE